MVGMLVEALCISSSDADDILWDYKHTYFKAHKYERMCAMFDEYCTRDDVTWEDLARGIGEIINDESGDT